MIFYAIVILLFLLVIAIRVKLNVIKAGNNVLLI